MIGTVADYRQYYAEEIAASAGLRSPDLIDAFRSIERERFLRPGPWVVRGEGDFGRPPRQTPDADPRHVYHNIVVGIDPARQLFNGQPSLLGLLIDSLEPRRGARLLHVGAGLGYYTAIMAHVVGPAGRVVAIEVDEALAREAREHLHPYGWVEVLHGNATEPLGEAFDGILINAGATHPLSVWLDALAPNGRLVLPLTVAMPPGGPIGKGLYLQLSRQAEDPEMAARIISTVAIYSGEGIRDEAMNERLGNAMRRPFPGPRRLRRDRHDESSECWLHGDGFCLSA
jgi:protein-L-isoaspartate(D-aspartate) O-methyltransferase